MQTAHASRVLPITVVGEMRIYQIVVMFQIMGVLFSLELSKSQDKITACGVKWFDLVRPMDLFRGGVLTYSSQLGS